MNFSDETLNGNQFLKMNGKSGISNITSKVGVVKSERE